MSHRDVIASALQAAGIVYWLDPNGALRADRQLWLSAHLVRCQDFGGVPTVFVASGMEQPWNGVVDAVHWLAHDRSRYRAAWGRVQVAFHESAPGTALDAAATLAAAGNQRGGLVIELATYALNRGGLTVRPLVRPAPDFGSLTKVDGWARLLDKRSQTLNRAGIPQIGRDLIRELSTVVPAFRWYRNASEGGFSGRVGGLQCCRIEDGHSHISLVSGDRFEAHNLGSLVGVITAVARDRANPQASIGTGKDEHLLESGVLRQAVPLNPLHAVFGRVALTPMAFNEPPLQLPALFGRRDRKRHVDALLRQGSVPWVVELKVASGGQGQYYRHAIAQVVLYREFVRSANALHPWFANHGLDASRCEAAIAFPELRGSNQVCAAIRSTLSDTAGSFLVGIHELEPWSPLRVRCMT